MSQRTDPFQRSRDVAQSFKARMDARRSTADRIADFLTQTAGSMAFLALNFIWFAIWIPVNMGLVPGVPVFDPFPFGLLTMIVSLEAIGLAIVVLISQNRAAQIAELREEIDLRMDVIAEEEITKLLEIVVKVAQKQGIDLSHDYELKEMLQPTDTEEIERILAEEITQNATNDAAAAER